MIQIFSNFSNWSISLLFLMDICNNFTELKFISEYLPKIFRTLRFLSMAGAVSNYFRSSFSNFFGKYSTFQVMQVRNTYIGIIHRIIQFVALVYISLYVIHTCNDFPTICFSSYIVWFKKGYQEVEEAHGSSVIKVKGVARVSTGNLSFDIGKLLLFGEKENSTSLVSYFQITLKKLCGMQQNI